MKKLTLVFLLTMSLLCILVQAQNVLAKPNASVKYSTLRAENPNEAKRYLAGCRVIPACPLGQQGR